MRCDGTIHILETGYFNGIGIVLVATHSNTAPTIKVGCILNGAVYAQNVSGVDSVTSDCDFRISIVNNFRRNFHILDRCTKFGGNCCDFDGGICGRGTDCHGAAR